MFLYLSASHEKMNKNVMHKMNKRMSNKAAFQKMHEKMKYAKAQAVIASATLMSTAVLANAEGSGEKKATTSATSNGKTILDSMISSVFGPLGKIVGGFMVVGGIFRYLMAQKDEDARGQHGAVMSIAVGALLFGASTILTNLNVTSLLE